MRRSLLVLAISAVLFASASSASAQSFSYMPEHGRMLHEHATTQHHGSVQDPSFHAHVGAIVPGSIEIHPLPGSIGHPHASEHGYAIVNDHPVVVEHSSRRVIHSFDH